MIRLAIALLPAALTLAACAPAQLTDSEREAGWTEHTLPVGGLTRHYRAFVPANLPPSPPLVVLLHGGTQSMRAIFESGSGGTQAWPALAAEAGFVLLVPNGTTASGDTAGDDQNWNDCRRAGTAGPADTTADDVGFVRALIDRGLETWAADPKRVYVTGSSNGGMMTHRLARELSDRIAAAATFISNRPVDDECGAPDRPVPLLMVNGTADPLMPFGGGSIGSNRGEVRSSDESRDWWLAVHGLSTAEPAVMSLPDLDPEDGSRITVRWYGDDRRIGYAVVEGGGHSMPSRDHLIGRVAAALVGEQNHDVEGARLAWGFLEAHRLP
jgi:polyhydroxybutyrate depolymerase